jgi:uncharacterized membrane protein YidH (DUF202 family)
MNKNKIGKVIIGLGVLVLIYSFFHMYSLVGSCQNGSSGCSAYTNWSISIYLGIFAVLFGIMMMILGRNKKF